MKVAYFPGCTLKTKAKELDRYARKCAEILDVSLEEVEDWQCCGGVFTTSRDEVATKLSSVRALSAAKKNNNILLKIVRRGNKHPGNSGFLLCTLHKENGRYWKIYPLRHRPWDDIIV